MLIEYRTYKMSTEYLKIVKIAMEASFVKDYDEQFVYAPSMNSESGVITCVYLHPSEPNITYIVTIDKQWNYLLTTVDHDYL